VLGLELDVVQLPLKLVLALPVRLGQLATFFRGREEVLQLVQCVAALLLEAASHVLFTVHVW
jgi:hypothetical protein